MISGETKEYLLEIIKDIILSGKVESFNSDINWGELETICKKHDIGGLIGNYIGKYAPEKIKKTFFDTIYMINYIESKRVLTTAQSNLVQAIRDQLNVLNEQYNFTKTTLATDTDLDQD